MVQINEVVHIVLNIVRFLRLQSLPRIPKLFQPSVACPRCQYPNDEVFRFCQSCGYNRKTVVLDKDDALKLKNKVDEEQIAARVKELIQTRNTT